MSLIRLRRAVLPRPAAWRNLLTALTTVVAIIAGLLAMHSLHLDADHHNSPTTVASTAPWDEKVGILAMGAVAADHASSSASHCADGCESDHVMAMMACVLALLVTATLFAIPLDSLPGASLRQGVLHAAAQAVGLAAPIPPSLHLLSISRT